MRARSRQLAMFAFAAAAATWACDEDSSQPPNVVGTDGQVGFDGESADALLLDAGASDGATSEAGSTVPGVLQFPMDVVLQTFGKANYLNAVDREISIDAVTLDYQNAFEGTMLVTKNRVHRLASRSETAPGDLPPGQSYKFWWTRVDVNGDVKAFICREPDVSGKWRIDQEPALAGKPANVPLANCSWELVLHPNPEKVEYGIRSPDSTGGLYLSLLHGGVSGNSRIAVGATLLSQAPHFQLVSPVSP